MYEGKWTALTVRKTFLEYFEQRGHTIGAKQSYHPRRKLHSVLDRHIDSIEPN